MTNAELLAKIKAEIERRYKEFDGKTGDIATASRLAYLDVLSFLSTLESEKPMNLEEEINRYLHEECSDDDEPGIHEIAEHFAQWGAEHLATSGKTLEIKPGDEVTINGHKIVYDKDKGYVTIVKSEESVPKDLEEAADKYEQEFFTDATLGEAFIAGAEWDREQMMKEAVEGRVFMSFVPGHNQMVMADVDLPTNTNVRVIVLPKED